MNKKIAKSISSAIVFLLALVFTASAIADETANPTDPAATSAPKVETQKTGFGYEPFLLSELIENMEGDNHFELPEKAQDFLREILGEGIDYNFKTHDNDHAFAYVLSTLGKDIWFNPANPPDRLGQALCHELLHLRDFKEFKPITSFIYKGIEKEQGKLFHQQVGNLTNMISHEYVKEHLESFGYENALSDTAEGWLNGLVSSISMLEKTFVSISEQLAESPNAKNQVGISNLQTIYHNLILMVLRDQLLFNGAYSEEVDVLLERFQAILDFVKESTAQDPVFSKLHRNVVQNAKSLRNTCKQYQASDKSTTRRYVLLRDALTNLYMDVGIEFGLVKTPDDVIVLSATSSVFESGESFSLDGSFIFTDVKVFESHEAEITPKDNP